MTVPVSSPIVSYVAAGVGPYPIPFPFAASADVKVSLRSAAGVVSSPAFTIAGLNLTLDVAPADGVVVVYRDTPDDQLLSLSDLAAFPAQAVEKALDRIALQQQEQTRDISAAVRAPVGEVLPPLPPAGAGGYLVRAASGAVVEVPTPAGYLSGPSVTALSLGVDPRAPDNTAAIAAMIANHSDKAIVFTAVGGASQYRAFITASVPINWAFEPGVELAYPSNPGANTRYILDLQAGAAGSVLRDLAFYGGRDLYGASHEYQTSAGGWIGLRVLAADVLLDGRTRFREFIDCPFLIQGDRFTNAGTMEVYNSSRGGTFGYFGLRTPEEMARGRLKRPWLGRQIARDMVCGPYSVYQHLLDVFFCEGLNIEDFLMDRCNGDGTGLSYAISGLTVVDCPNATVRGGAWTNPTSLTMNEIVWTFLGCENLTLNDLRCEGFAGIGFEINACTGSATGCIADGRYRQTTGLPLTASKGWSVGNGDYDVEFVEKPNHATKQFQIVAPVAVRTGIGMELRAECDVIAPIAEGNVEHNIWTRNFQTGESYPPANEYGGGTRPIINVTGGRARGSSGSGVYIQSGSQTLIHGVDCRNNGQDAAISALRRAGVSINLTANAGELIRVESCDLRDTQGAILQTDGASYTPFPANAKAGFEHLGFQKWVTLLASSGYHYGQTITLVDAGGAGISRTGRIIDFVDDEVLLNFSSAVTFSAAPNGVALSGTWSGAGTALVGVGGNAAVETGGRVWVTDGLEWRVLTKALTANALSVDKPFSAPLAGATLTMIRADVRGVPSAQYGCYTDGSARLRHKDNLANGVLSNSFYSDGSYASLEPGSNYDRDSGLIVLSTTLTGLLFGIPVGHKVSGVSTIVETTITGSTRAAPVLTDAAVAIVDRFGLSAAANIGLSKNSKVALPGGVNVATVSALRMETTGTPTAGRVRVIASFRVEAPALIPDYA